MQRRLVLVSTSRWRKATLERLGLPFEQAAPDFDEKDDEGLAPRDVARRFAEHKATSLAGRYPDSLLLGSDQVAEHEGERLSKPVTLEAVQAQLTRLSGRVHRLHTGIAVLDTSTGEMVSDVPTVSLTMRPLTESQIRAYVAHDKPVGCAGGYTIEGRGIALFEDIAGGDESAIVGLPLMSVTRLLARAGLDPLGV